MTVPGVVLDARARSVRRALKLEYLTVGWNLVEGGIGVAAAVLAGSVALLGFGVDSFVECASGLVLIWRLAAERRGMDQDAVERAEGRAQKLVGASLFLLAAYIAGDAVLALCTGTGQARASSVIGLTALSLVAMAWLARAKRRAAAALGSRAVRPTPFQTTGLLAVGHRARRHRVERALRLVVGRQAVALGMTWFIGREGLDAWQREECGCASVSPRTRGRPRVGGGCYARVARQEDLCPPASSSSPSTAARSTRGSRTCSRRP